MRIKFRTYNRSEDYRLVDDFLTQHYQPGNQDGNWIQPAWEYMHSHPNLDVASLGKIGIWEDDGNLVAVAHFESSLGEAFFEFHPDYRHLRRTMLEYAEGSLFGTTQDGRKYIHVFVNDIDKDFLALVARRGYLKDDKEDRTLSQFLIPDPFPPISLPVGFHLKSLADDCDWSKINRILWRGFNHPGEPPESEIEERKQMQDSPNFKHGLKIIVEAPKGQYASFCGMWIEPVNHYAYVEPVATDPDFRRLGLGKAAVLEGIRRCAGLGATVAFVGNDLWFYQAIGFRKVFGSECWIKTIG